ncbi:MAG: winged helix-turn-helix transcriptional regulator [Acidobacteriota bacterium]|nr:winged helix-turn-helix transcriptional regulator [Acidobacteriota bacterium]
MSDQLGLVFGALADPTRRQMLEALIRDGSTSAPALTAELPITRQAIAKHLSSLAAAGLIERELGTPGREVHYRLAPGALGPAVSWMRIADAAWAGRLDRLRSTLESGR